jgi:DNA-binding NtrC family response regulator
LSQADQSDRPTVLVVEDEAIIRLAAVDMIESAGFPVMAAADATAAMRLLEDHDGIGVVFTDVDMPRGVSGLELAEIVKNRWPGIHVIITSGKVEAGQAALAEDCVFFAKPYHEARIVDEVRRSLSSR